MWNFTWTLCSWKIAKVKISPYPFVPKKELTSKNYLPLHDLKKIQRRPPYLPRTNPDTDPQNYHFFDSEMMHWSLCTQWLIWKKWIYTSLVFFLYVCMFNYSIIWKSWKIRNLLIFNHSRGRDRIKCIIFIEEKSWISLYASHIHNLTKDIFLEVMFSGTKLTKYAIMYILEDLHKHYFQ